MIVSLRINYLKTKTVVLFYSTGIIRYGEAASSADDITHVPLTLCSWLISDYATNVYYIRLCTLLRKNVFKRASTEYYVNMEINWLVYIFRGNLYGFNMLVYIVKICTPVWRVANVLFTRIKSAIRLYCTSRVEILKQKPTTTQTLLVLLTIRHIVTERKDACQERTVVYNTDLNEIAYLFKLLL